MQAKSFIEILADELRGELRQEVRAEIEAEMGFVKASPAEKIAVTHKADQVQLWLNLRMGAKSVRQSGSQAVNRYRSAGGGQQSTASQRATAILQLPSAVSEQPKPVERQGKVTTIEQTFALEFFHREGSSLEAQFSESELKSEFRKIALRIHPDRHADANAEQIKSLSARFQTLIESANLLESTLN